jgi:predicted Fe-Mo cluster-binding NifX family protein
MSRTAIAIWQESVATTLDFAQALILVDVAEGKVKGRREIRIATASPQAIARRLEKVGVHTIVCGAISAPLMSAVEARGIRVIPFIHGRIEEVIRGCLEGTLTEERFHMAGCRPCRRRQPGCHRKKPGRVVGDRG